jgi:iron complex outermembrane receptor protein
LSILRPQSYVASVSDDSLTGRLNLSYQLNDNVMFYSGYSRGSKSGGINMSGLPLNASNLPALDTAVIRPEKNTTYELGVKTELFNRHATLNADIYYTTVKDFQANVVDTGPGALRGYLANIPLVKDRGVELDSDIVFNDHLSAHVSTSWIDGQFVSYAAGPCPLERIGTATTVCNQSGRPLSGLPKWAWNLGGEYRQPTPAGEAYVHAEAVYRGNMYGDPTDSQYTLLQGYTLVNMSLGLRATRTWEAFLWARNLTGANYMQNVTVQAGNSGLVIGTPGEPRTYGVTVKARF